jgi:hypothetical protein
MSSTQLPWQIIVIGGLALVLVVGACVLPPVFRWNERRRDALDGDLHYEFNWRD